MCSVTPLLKAVPHPKPWARKLVQPYKIPTPGSFATQGLLHTPSIAFRHLPPNSARFSYATEGALFISALLSTDAVSALRKVRVLIRLEET